MSSRFPPIAALSLWLIAGCGSTPHPSATSIEFTTVPVAAAGGSERLAPIRGRVTGSREGQRIVLFAKSGVWWVQPLTVQPFTDIAADGTWASTTHLGTDYAALLVDPAYRPPDTTETLPKAGGAIVAVATVKGTGDFAMRSRKPLTFSGYEWDAREIPSDRGGANDYDPDNAWVDDDGFLHLKLAQKDGRWTSAEVILTRALGYGTYVFTMRDTSRLDPAAAFGMFTWDEESSEQNHRELDIEISKWGDPRVPNAQYVVQPYYVPANVARFELPAGVVTHAIRWEPGRASFRTVRGAAQQGTLVAEHEFTAGIPTTGSERVRMNLYFFRYAPNPPQADVEVVVERFQYLP